MVLNDSILKAISWTLIHSLWQGILLAVGAGLIILATRKSASALRYNLLSALFVGFLVMVALTFNYELMPQGQEAITRLNLPVVPGNVNGFSETATIDYSAVIIEFLNRNANLIALIWLVIFTIKLIGIFNSLNQVYRIRNYRTFSPPEYWKQRISALSHQIHLQKTVVLLESALVKIPSVTGFFKPIILVPIGMLSNLPQDHVEAILLHELAHIRRKDYGINLLQHLAEMIFFFNPGLLWLSSLIKEERENCCDDIALGIIGNKAGFVHALVSFTEFHLDNELAVGFAGKKKHLLSRAKRIIYDDNKSLNAIEKTFLSVSLVLVAIIMIACANPGQPNEVIRMDVEAKIAESHAKIMEENAEIVNAATNKIDIGADQKSADADREAAKIAVLQTKQDQLSALASSKIPNAMICTPQPVANVEPIELSAPVEINTPRSHSVTTRTVNSKTTTSQTYEREVTTYDDADPKKNSRISLRTGVTGENLPDGMNVDRLTNDIISDLKHENIINSTNGLSYKLSNKSLIVNGVRQSENVYAKFKSKYVKVKMYAICYNYEYSGDKPLN